MQKNITAIIIAGGKSSRMGRNKALMHYQGQRLIDHAIHKMEIFTHNILISANTAIDNVEYPIVADAVTDIGPMGGLYTCLKASNTDYSIVIPCDVPNLQPDLYNVILDTINGFDAVIPCLPNGKLEPLVGAYSKSIIPIIEQCIALNDYKIVNFLKLIKVKYVMVDQIEQFKNINTPDDLS